MFVSGTDAAAVPVPIKDKAIAGNTSNFFHFTNSPFKVN